MPDATGIDDVFKALADPSRRRLLDSLNANNGQNLRQLCAGLDMARQSVSKHLAILEEANLVTTVRRGREKLHYLNPAPVNEIAERWINRYDRARVEALSNLKQALEHAAMATKPEFVYTSYIQTTPEQLWEALTSPEFTRQYWGMEFETDWQIGSSFVMVQGQARVEDPAQVILEADPPRRLAYTWFTFTPEWATEVEIGDETQAAWAAEPRSKVAFDIEQTDSGVRLTVTHDGFEPGSGVLQGVSQGWPIVISKLKTLLEAA